MKTLKDECYFAIKAHKILRYWDFERLFYIIIPSAAMAAKPQGTSKGMYMYTRLQP